MSINTFPFLQFPVLETKQLCLRRLRPEDDEAIFAYKSFKDELEFPRIARHEHISESQKFLAECLQKFYSRSAIYWAITISPGDTVIGTVALSAMHGDPRIECRAEISCALSPSYRRKGIMTEARIAIINYAFGNWDGLRRVHSEIALDNEPSRQMNLKLGFIEEGILRGYQRDNGKFTDIRILSLLRSDWEANSIYRISG
ncbi:MAG: GNAT family protein [Verrucomicrobiota bacterium]